MSKTVAGLIVLLVACGAPPVPSAPAPTADAPPPVTSFIALLGDFAGFEQWPQFDLGEQPADGFHVAGHRRVFINRPAARAATSFPVGTVIVKTVFDPSDGSSQVFAMAKRGSFNFGGAVGWEFFQLDAVTASPNIVWRGETPPQTALYGGQHVSCNLCHAMATANDSVLTPELALLPY